MQDHSLSVRRSTIRFFSDQTLDSKEVERAT